LLNKKKLKTAILICTIILVPIFVLYFCYFIYGFQISASSLFIKNISITDNIVKISGDNMHDSALAFSGYNIKLDKEQLIVKPRYSLGSPFNRHSRFEITYNTKGKPIKGIYIKGKNDKKQIWSASTDAKQVVLDFFKYYEQKDVTKMESLLIKGKKGISWELNKMDYVKLLKVEEDKTDVMKNGFMSNGLGSVMHPVEVKVYKVTFEIKFDGGSGSGMTDGKYDWSYFVIKEKENSPWLIADWGY
jgi:hypothetical protein